MNIVFYFALHFFKNNTFRPIRFKNKITFLYVVVEFFRFFFTVLLTFLFGGVFFFVYYFPAKMFLFLTIVIAISLRKQSQDQIRYLRNLHIPCHFCCSAQSYFQLAWFIFVIFFFFCFLLMISFLFSATIFWYLTFLAFITLSNWFKCLFFFDC